MSGNTIKENLNTPNPNVDVSKSWQGVFNDLNDNPIFRMSLGSKELFHSNFLAFLWDLDRDVFINMINDNLLNDRALSLDDRSKYELSRETDNFDILISHKDSKRVVCDLVIENKVKSIPYLAQLDDYVQKVKDKNKQNEQCSFLLLSLSQEFPDRINIEQCGQWKVISYSSLKTAIENSYNSKRGYGRSNQYIDDYLCFIEKLSRLQQIIIPEGVDESVLFLDGDIYKFKSLRLQDLYIKLRSSYFIVKLYNLLKEKGLPVSFIHSYNWSVFEEKKDNTHIFLNLGYNQGNGQIAAWIYSQKEPQPRTYEIVIQGKQYRHGIGQKQRKAQNNSAKRDMLNTLWKELNNDASDSKFLNFKDFSLQETVMPKKEDANFRFKTEDGNNKKSGPFDCYGDSYVYRYVDISKKKIGDLLETMVNDIHSVFNDQKNNEKPL